MSRRLLGIYLNDHLAGAVGGLELARRTQSSNEGTELGSFLEKLIIEIEEDKAALEAVMDHLGVRKNPTKQAVVWLAEKVGRYLKLNGQLTGYSDLSRLLELETLALALEGKLSLWRSLIQVRRRCLFPRPYPSRILLLGRRTSVSSWRSFESRRRRSPSAAKRAEASTQQASPIERRGPRRWCPRSRGLCPAGSV